MSGVFQGHVLHGFLGLPSDWEFLERKWNYVDLFNAPVGEGLWSWAGMFNDAVKETGQKRLLIGYSLGGRLALHALIDSPRLWSGAVIISANPGLQTAKEKKARLERDLQWSQRFLSEPWELLMKDWNAQHVFSGDDCAPVRKEEDYSRTALAGALKGWSLGKQNDLRQAIRQLSVPVLWIAGERDPKSASIAKSLKFSHSQSKVWIDSEAGHRVPWQQKNSFKQELATFLKEIS
jgi:2-succinyl-6-hydroxy-2,4-cyclohexadiene-1-carboxylate synthase